MKLIRHPILIAFFALCVIAQTAAWVSGQTAVQWQTVLSTINDIQTAIGVMQQQIAVLQATPPSGGSGTVVSVGATTPLSISGTATINPTVNLTIPLTAANGGTGVVSPAAHSIPLTEGTSAFTLLSCTGFLIGTGSSADPICRVLAESDLPTSGVTAGTYNSANVTVNAQGFVTAASNGAGTGTNNSGTGPAIAQYLAGTGVTLGPSTVSGDATIAQGGALTVTKTNGTAFGALATLGVGTGLTSSAGNLTLTSPVTVALGGTQCGAPTTVASLPGSPTQGEICNVTDSDACTAGTHCVHTSGSTKCQCTWNGTDWFPAGGAASAASGGINTLSVTAPITSTGGVNPTLALTTPLSVANGGSGLSTASANTVFAGPTGGAAAAPTFRLLGPADVPGTTVMRANEASTGTVVSTLTKTTGAPSTVIQATTTDTVGVIGICIANCGTTGTATIQQAGLVSCVFDGATTSNDFIQISSTTAGDCHDTGATTYPTVAGEVIGKVLSTNASAGTYTISLFGPDVVSPSGSGSGTVASGTANQVGYYAATGTTVSGNANFTVTSAGYATVAGLTNNCKNASGVALVAGTVTVSSPASCFTTTSIPLCADITTPNALVKCTSGSGSLVITLPTGSLGGPTDTIAWAILG